MYNYYKRNILAQKHVLVDKITRLNNEVERKFTHACGMYVGYIIWGEHACFGTLFRF